MKRKFTKTHLAKCYLKYARRMMLLIKAYNKSFDPLLLIEIDDTYRTLEAYRKELAKLEVNVFDNPLEFYNPN